MNGLIRALTVALVLCIAALGVLFYYRAEHPGATLVGDASNREVAGGLGRFTAPTAPLAAPALAFTARDGTPKALADFRGKPVLVNLWATWCGPCIEEMPSLARLQVKRPGLTILALSEDRQGEVVVAPFLAKLKLDGLAIYLDPANAAIKAFGVRGLPTSFLVDADGRLVWSYEGGADWDAPEALSRIDAALAGKP
jgi:thiol-disulfide isomerase/thioredoxin